MTTTHFTRRPLYLSDMDLEVFVSGTITDAYEEDPIVDLMQVEGTDGAPMEDAFVASWAETLREKLLRSYAAF